MSCIILIIHFISGACLGVIIIVCGCIHASECVCVCACLSVLDVLIHLLHVWLTAPESGLLDEASTYTLAQGEKAYITYPFDIEEGVTLQYRVEEGTLNIFGSFSVRNPTQATADFAFAAKLQTAHYYVSPEKYNEATGMQANPAMPGNATAPNVTLFTSASGLNRMNTFTVTTALGEVSGAFGKQ